MMLVIMTWMQVENDLIWFEETKTEMHLAHVNDVFVIILKNGVLYEHRNERLTIQLG